MIKRGSDNSEVKQWQEFLISLGHDLTADGIFGAKTQQATREFQESVGLTADGIVGKGSYKEAVERGYSGDFAS